MQRKPDLNPPGIPPNEKRMPLTSKARRSLLICSLKAGCLRPMPAKILRPATLLPMPPLSPTRPPCLLPQLPFRSSLSPLRYHQSPPRSPHFSLALFQHIYPSLSVITLKCKSDYATLCKTLRRLARIQDETHSQLSTPGSHLSLCSLLPRSPQHPSLVPRLSLP